MLKVFKILQAKSSIPFCTRTVLDKRITVLDKRITVLDKRTTVLGKRITILDKRILEEISVSLSPFVFRFVYRFF